jgi:hypothetical protein
MPSYAAVSAALVAVQLLQAVGHKDTACPKLLAEALAHFLHLVIVDGISKKIATVA